MRKLPIQVRQQKYLLILRQQHIVSLLEEMTIFHEPANLHPHLYLAQLLLTAPRKMVKIIQVGCVN